MTRTLDILHESFYIMKYNCMLLTRVQTYTVPLYFLLQLAWFVRHQQRSLHKIQREVKYCEGKWMLVRLGWVCLVHLAAHYERGGLLWNRFCSAVIVIEDCDRSRQKPLRVFLLLTKYNKTFRRRKVYNDNICVIFSASPKHFVL